MNFSESKSLLSLSEPPGFLPSVLAAVERDWLAYAAEELLVARWVTITSTGGHRTVQRQLDDGRGRKERGGHLFDKEKGLHKTWGVPSVLILTVQDMAEAVYKHWLTRPDNQPVKIFCRKFYRMYEGTREEDLTWIIRQVKHRTKEADNGVLPPIQAPAPSPEQAFQRAKLPVRPSFENLPRRVVSTPMKSTTSFIPTHTPRPTNMNDYKAAQTSNMNHSPNSFNSANSSVKEVIQIDLTTPPPVYRRTPSPQKPANDSFKSMFASSYVTSETGYMGSDRGKDTTDKESSTRHAGFTESRTVSGPAGFPDASAFETPSKRPLSMQKWLLDSASKKSARKRPMLSPDLAGNIGLSSRKESPSSNDSMDTTVEDAGDSALNFAKLAPTGPKGLNIGTGNRDVFGPGGGFDVGFGSNHSNAPPGEPNGWSVDLGDRSTSGSDRYSSNAGKELFGGPFGKHFTSSFSKAIPTKPMGFDPVMDGREFSGSSLNPASLGNKTTPTGPGLAGRNDIGDSTSRGGVETLNGHMGGFGNRYYSGIGGVLDSIDRPESPTKPAGNEQGRSGRNFPRTTGHLNSRGGFVAPTGPATYNRGGYRGGYGTRDVSGPAEHSSHGNGKAPPTRLARRTDSRTPRPHFRSGEWKEKREHPAAPHHEPPNEPRHQADCYRPSYNQSTRRNRNDYDPRVQPSPGSRYDYRYKHGE